MSLEELEMPRSLLFAWHSPFFEPRSLLFEPHSLLFASLELRGMGRKELFGRREGGGMAHGGLFAPLEVELAAFSLAFGRLEGRGMRREEQGTRREEVFEGREVPSGRVGNEGMRLAGLDARRLALALFDN
ncbi:MAG: hypothetical protein ACJ76Y_25825 [Thermoanaerobaculia bacterium]